MNPEQKERLRRLLTEIEKDPEDIKAYFDDNREGAEHLRPILTSALYEVIQKFSYLQDLYTALLSPINPNATALFLASGLGDEVLIARQLMPKGRLIAIDNIVHPQAVMSQIATGSELYPIDLQKDHPQKIVETLGQVPDYVICRNPNVWKDKWMPKYLSEWMVIVKENQRKMIITNFHQAERTQILKAALKTNITPQIFTLRNGPLFTHPTEGDYSPDKFITFVT